MASVPMLHHATTRILNVLVFSRFSIFSTNIISCCAIGAPLQKLWRRGRCRRAEQIEARIEAKIEAKIEAHGEAQCALWSAYFLAMRPWWPFSRSSSLPFHDFLAGM